MKHSTHILILQISLISSILFLALIGLNAWTGYNVELGNKIVAQLHFLRDVLILLNFMGVCVLGCAMINQIRNWNDPMSWPFVVRLQFMLIAYIFLFTGSYTLFMYPPWVFSLGPIWWLIGTIYRYAIPHEYDVIVEDWCVTFIGSSLYGCMVFTLTLFFYTK